MAERHLSHGVISLTSKAWFGVFKVLFQVGSVLGMGAFSWIWVHTLESHSFFLIYGQYGSKGMRGLGAFRLQWSRLILVESLGL